MKDVAAHNRMAWNKQARNGCRWSIPASEEEIANARLGKPRIILTPDTPVPLEWLGDLKGRELLCLSSAGGQQVPILAAAGANVTSYDLSDEQLALDQQVAKREGLTLKTARGDMRDLSVFPDASFDTIVHVCSNCFVPDIEPVWRECHRVLRSGGELLTGFLNPVFFLFDHDAMDRGEPPIAIFPLPYTDKTRLTPERYQQLVDEKETLGFSHSLNEQIGGQLKAGFHLVGFYEDTWGEATSLNHLFPLGMCTRARKAE